MWQAALGALGTSLLSKFIDRGSSQVVDKVTGVPTPGATTNPGGTEQGQSMKSYMDSAFPGTNAWERLGVSNPMSGVSSTAMARRSEEAMQAKEFKQQRDLTSMNNRASIISSTAGISPEARDSALEAYEGRGTMPSRYYDTLTSQGSRKTEAEIKGLHGRSSTSSVYGLLAERLGGYINKGLDTVENASGRAGRGMAKVDQLFADAKARFNARTARPWRG